MRGLGGEGVNKIEDVRSEWGERQVLEARGGS